MSQSQNLVNRNGDPVSPGRGHQIGGDTGRKARNLWYCGQQKNECRCGGCDGKCGPNSGCPCNACVELLGFRINSAGVLAKRGGQGKFFCGRLMNIAERCRCGECWGRGLKWCEQGGCSCIYCALINDEYEVEGQNSSSDSEEDSGGSSDDDEVDGIPLPRLRLRRRAPPPPPTMDFNIRRRETLLNSLGDACRPGANGGDGGDTGMEAQQLLYCGKRKSQCRCGGCDERCGPTTGCPCTACLELVYDRLLHQDEVARGIEEISIRPDARHPASGSGNQGNGSSSTLTTAFSGLAIATQNSNSNGNDRRMQNSAVAMNPENSNNSACAATPSNSTSTSAQQKNNDPENMDCVVCLERRKCYIIVPCGHYAYCKQCARTLQKCAICRGKVERRVKVYES